MPKKHLPTKLLLTFTLLFTLLFILLQYTHALSQPPSTSATLSPDLHPAGGMLWDTWEDIQSILREQEWEQDHDPNPPLQGFSLPTSVDLTDLFPTPRHQGTQNSCVGWAVAYAVRSSQEEVKRGWGLDTDEHLFSPSYVYNQLNGGANDGISIYSAMRIIYEQGVSTLASFPYNASDWLTQPNEAQREEAAHFKVDDFYIIQGLENIKRRLADGDGVVIGIDVLPDFDTLSPSNPIFDDPSGTSRGGHAVTLIGYSDDMQAFKFINSWGTAWGLGGYGWISYELMADVRANQYSVAVGYVMGEPIVIENYFVYALANGEAVLARYIGTDEGVAIPDTLGGFPVTAIGDGAFQGNTRIKTVSIPEGVTRLGEQAFMNCTELEVAIIPKIVTAIGQRAFHHVRTARDDIPLPKLVIYCENSYVLEYALQEGIPFVELGLVRVEGVSIEGEQVITLYADGDSELQLNANVYPTDAGVRTVTWTSSAPKVATVSDTGAVTALTEGTAVITVKTLDGGFTADVTINVEILTPVWAIRLESAYGEDEVDFGTIGYGKYFGGAPHRLVYVHNIGNTSTGALQVTVDDDTALPLLGAWGLDDIPAGEAGYFVIDNLQTWKLDVGSYEAVFTVAAADGNTNPITPQSLKARVEVVPIVPDVTWPQDLLAVLGQTLGDIDLSAFGEVHEPAGRFSWTEGDSTLVGDVGLQVHSVTFTPDSGNYTAVSNDVNVWVFADDEPLWEISLEPNFDGDVADFGTIEYGKYFGDAPYQYGAIIRNVGNRRTGALDVSIDDDTVFAFLAWATDDIAIGGVGYVIVGAYTGEVDVGVYEATITVAAAEGNTNPIEPLSFKARVEVLPIKPDVTWPHGLVTFIGRTLGDIDLSAFGEVHEPAGRFSWTEGGGTSVGDAGLQVHSVTFTPDSGNYFAVSFDVSVYVDSFPPTGVGDMRGMTAAMMMCGLAALGLWVKFLRSFKTGGTRIA